MFAVVFASLVEYEELQALTIFLNTFQFLHQF